MYRILIIILTVVLIGGCAWGSRNLAAHQAAQAQQEQYEREAYRERLFSNCDRMGFQRGTDGHANCILAQHQQNQQQAMQLLQMQQQQQQAIPRCSAFPPGLAGYKAARGECY